MAAGSATVPAAPGISRIALVAPALLALLLGSPVGHSFAPPVVPSRHLGAPQLETRDCWRCSPAARGGVEKGDRYLGQDAFFEGQRRTWKRHRAYQRRTGYLQAGTDKEGDDVFKVRNMSSGMKGENVNPMTGGDDAMKKAMFELDPDTDEHGPVYFGTDGYDGPAKEWDKEPEEIRFSQCYVAFCIDREEKPDEPKNHVFWGVRQVLHLEHVKWARVLTRTLEDDPDREAAILWDRSVLSPLKYKVMGNMMCIRSHSKEAAARLLEEDPFRKAGLYGTVSLYRYPYSQDGEFNWQLSQYPYMALCMDRKGQSQLRKETRPRHLEYLGGIKRCTGAGPIFDPTLEEGDPKSVPIGSLVFFNADDDDEARDTVESDPYNEAGLFDSIFIARFNELDLSGLHMPKPLDYDPMRDMMAKEGLALEKEYPKDPEWKPFSNLKWLDVENEKRKAEDYLKARTELYEQRDIRLETNRINKDAKFTNGLYVYVGKRNETEWYDFWPTYIGPNDNLDPQRFAMENSYLPVDVENDDL